MLPTSPRSHSLAATDTHSASASKRKGDVYKITLVAVGILSLVGAVIAHFTGRSAHATRSFAIGGAGVIAIGLIGLMLNRYYEQRQWQKLYELIRDLNNWLATTSLTEEKKSEVFEKIVTCYQSSASELNLSGYSLTSLPQEIGKLMALKTLNLNNNQLSNLPPEIGKLVALKTLDLYNNRLSDLPQEIGKLKALEYLYLQNNWLSDLPQEIGKLTALKYLYLQNNRLSDLPQEIGKLMALKYLYLENNQLSALPREIECLTALKRLHLYNNQLSALPPAIGKLTALVELYLYNNQLSALPNQILELNRNCDVYLENNPLSERVLAALQEATNADDYSGPQIHFSMHESSDHDERSAEELFASLCTTAAGKEETIQLKYLLEKAETLQIWLSRLESIGDFKSGSPKGRELAQFIVNTMKRAEEDEKYREVFFGCIEGATATCGDRIALSLLHLGINEQIAQSIGDGDLKQTAHLLLHGSWALDLLERVARAKAATLRFVDEIEVYLAYPIMLKERLNLPIILDTMLYFACSGVTPKDLDDAENYVKKSLEDKEACVEWLVQNNTWEKALKNHNKIGNEFKTLEDTRALASEKGEYEKAASDFKVGLKKLTEQVVPSGSLAVRD